MIFVANLYRKLRKISLVCNKIKSDVGACMVSYFFCPFVKKARYLGEIVKAGVNMNRSEI